MKLKLWTMGYKATFGEEVRERGEYRTYAKDAKHAGMAAVRDIRPLLGDGEVLTVWPIRETDGRND